jgi:hypothetical protein
MAFSSNWLGDHDSILTIDAYEHLMKVQKQNTCFP